MKSITKIGILCSYTFPEGMAPTTRIIAYGKGLVQNGVEVEVISFSVLLNKKKKRSEGVVEGIKYTHPFFYNPDRYHSKLYRVCYANIMLIINCIKTIILSNKLKKFDYFLLSFDEPRYLIFYGIIFRILGIKVAFIGDEFPEAIRQLREKVSAFQVFEFKLAYKFIQKRILMTKALQKYYDENVCPKPTYILSSVIDTDRFNGLSKQRVEREYLCYMGNLMLAKDNVDNIVNAFARIAEIHQNIDLYLYGNPISTDKAIIEKLIERYNLQSRVIFKGRANYNDVPQILTNARILVTSQPLTKRAQGGFPTKMCEYMLTGVPTVLTDVGEIHEYVTDNINAYMVSPCNPEEYAAKLDYILSNYEEAIKVAKRAKDYVINNFGSKQATIGLCLFLSKK